MVPKMFPDIYTFWLVSYHLFTCAPPPLKCRFVSRYGTPNIGWFERYYKKSFSPVESAYISINWVETHFFRQYSDYYGDFLSHPGTPQVSSTEKTRRPGELRSGAGAGDVCLGRSVITRWSVWRGLSTRFGACLFVYLMMVMMMMIMMIWWSDDDDYCCCCCCYDDDDVDDNKDM